MKIGENAPDFTLKDGEGNDWKLSEQRGKIVVLLFYPGDDTPVCTKQMCSVRDNWEDYKATGAEVVGISTDSAESHKNFAGKYDLPLTLLADENGETLEKYDMKSWLPNRAARGVVVIDKNGKIAYHKAQALSLLRPKDDEILQAIEKAQNVG
ncbi:peroxiredoxin [soil metagenome]